MKRSNYPLRLEPSLMQEARKLAESEGVALNQLFNVAVAEKLATLRAEKTLWDRISRVNRLQSAKNLIAAGKTNPPLQEDDQFSIGGLPVLIVTVASALRASPDPVGTKIQPAPNNTGGCATPQLGQLKKRLERTRGR